MLSTNFEFLRDRWPELADLGAFAEIYCHNDPASSRIKCRLLAEHLAKLVSQRLHRPIVTDNFLSILEDLRLSGALPNTVLDLYHQLRIAGNKAAHNIDLKPSSAISAVRTAFDLSRWWVRVATGDSHTLPPAFEDPPVSVPPDPKLEVEQLEKLKVAADQILAENEALRRQLADMEELRRQKQLEYRSSEVRELASDAVDALSFSEAETRRRLIDTMLWAAGWDVEDPDQVQREVPVAGQDTATGLGRVDYVLYDDDGAALAVIEAKRVAEDPVIGRKQAQAYADALEAANKDRIRPLIFLGNGYETILVDDRGGPASLPIKGYPDRQIYGLPSKGSLSYRARHQRRDMKDPAGLPHRPEIANRPYQVEAIKAVAECFGEKRRRKALVVQATGTGKTRVAIALAELLMRAGFARRVLFLCDRRELRRQAKNAFTQFMPDCNVSLLNRTKDPAAQVVLSTYPAMMKRFQEYDVAWFDLVIADESHRSIYNKYRDLFLYFDALQIGLTATPRQRVSHNTYGMFNCPPGDPTYFYEYDQAVQDGYLVDFTPIEVTTKFLREGIHSDDLTEKQKQQLEDQGLDPESIDVDADRLDKQAYNKDTNRKILANLMANGLRDVTDNGPGKSVIFARNHIHADILGKLFQEMYPEFGPDYCAVIDNYNPRAEQLIDDFKTPQKDPIIAVSVDMLDTGIDVPEIINLVFAKPIKSYVKFWQMIGRGTRLCKDLHGPGKDKSIFYLFDHWGNCEYFDSDRTHEEAGYSQSLLERLFEARLELAQTSLDCYDKATFETTVALIRTMLKSLPDNSLPIKEKHRSRLHVLSGAALEQFEPATLELMRRDLGPLMRYVNIRGQKEAYDFDLLITDLQKEELLESARTHDLRGGLDNVLASLRTNIKAVQDKFEEIKSLRHSDFWAQSKSRLLAELEIKRQHLRGIMKYALPQGLPPGQPPLILDLTDSQIHYDVRSKVRPSPEDMREYRERVRQALEPHFDSDPSLAKLRRGQGLSDSDFDALASLVLTQNNGIDLNDLRSFYPETSQLEKELRAIVGLDGEMVKNRFAEFYVKHPGLSSMQIAFLNLLQKHIQSYGPVKLENLYEAPFTHFNSEGPEAVFPDEDQFNDLIEVIRSFEGSMELLL